MSDSNLSALSRLSFSRRSALAGLTGLGAVTLAGCQTGDGGSSDDSSSGGSDERGEQLLAGLRAAGWPEDAPVVVVHKASWPGQQRIVRGTVATIKQLCREAGIVSQAMVIASPTLGARHWPELTKSRLYDAAFTHRFRRASAPEA